MHIYSDNLIVLQSLKAIAKLVSDNGGTINPGLTIHHHKASLSISCERSGGEDLLLDVPQALFVPVSNLDWHAENGNLLYKGCIDGLDALQRELLMHMLCLYNAVGKMDSFAETSTYQLLPNDKDLNSWIHAARPDFRIPTNNLARLFIETRLSYCMKDEAGRMIGCLMPLLDLLNHHPNALKFNCDDNMHWRTPIRHCKPPSLECFARYHSYDNLSIALGHNYFENATCHIASLDCSLELPDIGNIHVRGTDMHLRVFNPPTIRRDSDEFVLQDIVLESEKIPVLKTFLALAIRSRQQSLTQARAEQHAVQIIKKLIESNRQRYLALQSLCDNDKNFPLRKLFSAVASHQLQLLAEIDSAAS